MALDIEKLSLSELFDLNKRVVRRIQYLQNLKTRAQLDQFEVGDRVSFRSDGRSVEGIAVRVNRKTVSVKTHDSQWTIPPRFLTRMPGTPGVPLTIEDILSERKDS